MEMQTVGILAVLAFGAFIVWRVIKAKKDRSTNVKPGTGGGGNRPVQPK